MFPHENKPHVFTSDLRAAGKAGRHRWSRSVSGRMLGLSHPVRLMDALAPAELPVLCRARAEPRCLIVTSLKKETKIKMKSLDGLNLSG